MIIQSTFAQAVNEYDEREGRADFFALCRGLIEHGFEVEACMLLLATWNFARFRYAVKQFDIEGFRNTLTGLNDHFRQLRDQTIMSIDLSTHGSHITAIFEALSTIRGIEFTGAPKLMHLKNPDLFVMWDEYIRGAKTKKYYGQLEILRSREWTYKKYDKNSEGYISFLEDMKCNFSHILPPSNSKTLAKAIDEFNYVKITLPIQEMEAEKKRQRMLHTG